MTPQPVGLSAYATGLEGPPLRSGRAAPKRPFDLAAALNPAEARALENAFPARPSVSEPALPPPDSGLGRHVDVRA